MAEQPPVKERLPIPPLPTTAYTTKASKQRKTAEEKHANKRELDRARDKTRVHIGVAFQRWRELRDLRGLKTDADVATFLLDSVDYKYPFMMSSPNEVERETPSSFQSSKNGKESGKKDAACQKVKGGDEQTTTNQSENNENSDVPEDEDEDFRISLSVGDGRYLVDLGSSSEFIVDEECILQLFKSCRECNRLCTVKKQVKGLKLVISQKCSFCESRWTWTNLPDDDEGNLQIN